jgi:hypothetical protein
MVSGLPPLRVGILRTRERQDRPPKPIADAETAALAYENGIFANDQKATNQAAWD